ncbi:DNA polymerase-3 subunit epsilon [Sphingopyxis italica]|uniref:DNA polymerase-3 subunit epsilon n=1 Tax=Sphingopyxis italica TaxID=1129133 RepID=A0A7X5XQK3_9SPHN|nr:3'-5' exonuclease [Sphingopyxis italica]NJB89487.1 DNA polymerase-3 subunit epsilon [Sphingopyxis italica]
MSVAEEGEHLAQRLSRIPGFRVLRELQLTGLVDQLAHRSDDLRTVAIVDTETTGLDPNCDKVVEIAIQRLSVDLFGRIVEVERPRSWREDPARPMPPRLTLLTGLTDEDLAGCAFDDDAITILLGEVDIIVAHNAAFDRPFIDLRFPILRNKAWGCSLSQLDWLILGFDGRALGHLLLQAGWYFQGHRAEQDVQALSTLLGCAARDGRTIMSHLLERCDRPNFLVAAVGAPFDAKDLLKVRGYRWNAERRHWWREIDEDDIQGEKIWLDQVVYKSSNGQPTLTKITASERFSRFVNGS